MILGADIKKYASENADPQGVDCEISWSSVPARMLTLKKVNCEIIPQLRRGTNIPYEGMKTPAYRYVLKHEADAIHYGPCENFSLTDAFDIVKVTAIQQYEVS